MDKEREDRQIERLSAALTDEARFRLLVNAVTDYAIYMLDTSGRIASWNAGAERFKGYAAHEVIGRHFSIFYTDEDIQSYIEAFGEFCAEETPPAMQRRLRWAMDSDWTWLLFIFSRDSGS
jgi:PAS domain S-box-containing protein